MGTTWGGWEALSVWKGSGVRVRVAIARFGLSWARVAVLTGSSQNYSLNCWISSTLSPVVWLIV
ncbi:hypothetical protein [Lyngbya sp. CCY1209]|uniref:hypothetical protein n=1 Tax=Lyngbya sp. CCY1209 TaxID=2886103 RepID=UPI002D208048|nr:hypothetical protein [Lyngbya sp. CCY1209]MEB3884252.1 hypothetical protein [Lyngbya sp. CCY1209]